MTVVVLSSFKCSLLYVYKVLSHSVIYRVEAYELIVYANIIIIKLISSVLFNATFLNFWI